jgi:hydroxyacylglutathione hydrolase
VRSPAEFRSGHIAGAAHVMCGELPEHLERVPRGRKVAVTCGGGYRSTVAVSVLERAGFEGVMNVPGGMGAWKRAGLPVTLE